MAFYVEDAAGKEFVRLPFFRFFKQKPLRMAWTVEKAGRKCYLVGTAHFFPYSFGRSLTELLQQVETALFEGPLDEASMKRIADWGRQGQDTPCLAEALEPDIITEINRQLGRRLNNHQENDLYAILQPTPPNYFDLYTRNVRPWMAFFSIWTTYLNWEYSVDMEAYGLAQKLDKKIGYLETIEEQLAVLDGIPFERLVRQLSQIREWPEQSERYVQAFLAGDVETLLAMLGRFPTRCPAVVDNRDRALFERSKQVFERERAVAFLGAPHIPGVSTLFREAGYQVRQGIE